MNQPAELLPQFSSIEYVVQVKPLNKIFSNCRLPIYKKELISVLFLHLLLMTVRFMCLLVVWKGKPKLFVRSQGWLIRVVETKKGREIYLLKTRFLLDMVFTRNLIVCAGVVFLLLFAQMISVQVWLTVDSSLISHLNLSLFLNDYERILVITGLKKASIFSSGV